MAVYVRALLVAALLALMGALLVSSSLHKKLVVDEPDNLLYGREVLRKGPVPPERGQRMPILALNALGCPSRCRVGQVNVSEARRLLVRLPTMAFAIALGLLLCGWAGAWYGPRAGLLALFLYVLHPSFLAHGKQVTSDVQAAFFTVAVVATAWRLARRRGSPIANLALCALATAGALLSKFTSALLVPIVMLHLALASADSGASRLRRIGRAAAWGASYLLAVLLFLNAAYGFRGSFRRADSYPWDSEQLRSLASLPLPLPLPEAYVLGIDYSYDLQERPGVERGNNYVLGRLNTGGVWYAFPLMILLKTPLGLFAIAVVAALTRVPGEAGRGAGLYLVFPFAAFTCFFSLFVVPQLGIRYLLPALPFLIVYAARAAVDPSPRRRALVLALALWAAVSGLSYHPHPMSYFNELIGRRVNAYRFLADSNLDWEDRSYDIARYRAAHPERPLVVDPARPQAGWIAVSATLLVGVYERDQFRWLREGFEPVDHIGYSYLLFHVSPERLRQVLGTSRLHLDGQADGRLARLWLELVELAGIEPATS